MREFAGLCLIVVAIIGFLVNLGLPLSPGVSRAIWVCGVVFIIGGANIVASEEFGLIHTFFYGTITFLVKWWRSRGFFRTKVFPRILMALLPLFFLFVAYLGWVALVYWWHYASCALPWTTRAALFIGPCVEIGMGFTLFVLGVVLTYQGPDDW